MSRSIAVFVLVAAGATGCSDDSSPPNDQRDASMVDAPPADASPPDASMPADAPVPPDADEALAFVGTWLWATGVSTLTCNDGTMDSHPVSGNFTISKGTSSDLVLVEGACATRFDVDRERATVRPGETCVYYDDTVAVTAAFNTFELMLTSDIAATVRYRATLTGTDSQGSFSCTDDLNGTVTKVSAQAAAMQPRWIPATRPTSPRQLAPGSRSEGRLW